MAEKAALMKTESNKQLSAEIEEMKKTFDQFSSQRMKLVGSPLEILRNDHMPFDFNEQCAIADMNTSSFFPVNTNNAMNNPYANHSFAVGANQSLLGTGNLGHVLKPIQPTLNFVRKNINNFFRVLKINLCLW